MKRLLLVLCAALSLRADPNTITYTLSMSPFEQAPQSCGNFQNCTPYSFYVPQFNGPGAFSTVSWSFTDNISYYGGLNDLYDPLIGNPYTWTTTEGDVSSLLGLDASTMQLNSGITCGCGQISTGSWWSYATAQASGTAPDVNPFVGTGYAEIDITPFLFASFPTSSNGWVDAALIEEASDATLTVTYLDPSGVPEPNYFIVLIVVLAIILAVLYEAIIKSS